MLISSRPVTLDWRFTEPQEQELLLLDKGRLSAVRAGKVPLGREPRASHASKLGIVVVAEDISGDDRRRCCEELPHDRIVLPFEAIAVGAVRSVAWAR